MILTYKVKHDRDFSSELLKAKQVAEFSIVNRDKLTSKHVKQFGLKSAISNQILRKYGKNKKCRSIKKVKLIVPNQGIKFKDYCLTITCLNLVIGFVPRQAIEKINQVEIDNKYCYIACTIKEKQQITTKTIMGVDLNTTGHCAVAAIIETGKVFKLGKQANHIHKKYKGIRKQLQKQGKNKLVKKIKNKESRIIRDLNHKISRKIVDVATANQSLIVLEDLKNVRKDKKRFKKSFKYSLNSWSYAQLRNFIEYKAKSAGIPVTQIDPRYTSQTCSRCGLLGKRTGKLFKCPCCGHVENADVNAAFNIALVSSCISRLNVDRDAFKGSTDTPKGATTNMLVDFRTLNVLA